MKNRLPISLLIACAPLTDLRAEVNFAEDVAPIVFNHCASCHRPGEAAPFSLTEYAQVKKRARQIAEVAEERIMPPWHAESTHVKFAGDRRLSEAQIATLLEWSEAGAPEGDPDKVPPLPDFPEGWQLGEPDLVVSMDEAFEVPASGPDVYRNFVLPLNLKEDKWVKAIEFRPGSPEVVHHSLFFFDTSGEARRHDAESETPGFKRMGKFAREGSLGGWAVGGLPNRLPDGLAYRLPKGADLILSTHFHPSGKPEREKSTVGIHFGDKPPERGFTGIQLPPRFGATSGIDIPPGESRYVKKDSFVLPVDVSGFGVSAHAHYLGKEMKLEAVLPDGERKQLLWIREWDFDWQEQYPFEDFFDLPKGTRLESTVVWDNSAENIYNPNDPPKRVRWGRESGDEMGSITLQVTTAKSSELAALQRAYRTHVWETGKQRIEEIRDSEEGFASIPKAIIERHRERFDKDGDGKLNAEERAAALEAWRRHRRERGRG